MTKNLRAAGGRLVVLGVLAACGALTACATPPREEPAPPTVRSARLPAEDIQAEIMAFADSFTALIGQAADRVAEQLPDKRASIHEEKLRMVQNAITIASGPNPIGGLLDMTVMVTLQRQVIEEYWLPEQYGPAGAPLLDAVRILEEDVWAIARKSLDAPSVSTLEALIPEIRKRYPDLVRVSSLRASEFAESRRTALAKLAGGGSLLQLFRLDPLASLSPANQELAQTRLLAERAFFWGNRLPLILNWQFQGVILDSMAQPETRQVLDAATRLTEAGERLSAVAADLNARLPEERDATIDRIAERLTAEREAAVEQMAARLSVERKDAIDQAAEAVARERQEILRTFEQEEVHLRGLLDDLRLTMDAGNALSAALNTTIESTERLVASFEPSEPPDPDAPPPPDLAAYRTTAETVTATARELNQLVVSLQELMSSPAWESRETQLDAATDRAQAGLEQLIDRGYRRGLVLVAVLIAGSLAAALVYRVVTTRLVRRAE